MKLYEHKFELMVDGASLNLLLHKLPFTNDLWSFVKVCGQSLQLMSLQRRSERYILIQIWKQLHKQSTGEITIRFCSKLRLGVQAIVPSINHFSRLANNSLYEKYFAVNGVPMWNALPTWITTIDSESRFRLKIANYL